MQRYTFFGKQQGEAPPFFLYLVAMGLPSRNFFIFFNKGYMRDCAIAFRAIILATSDVASACMMSFLE